jgi:hypothetical protein
LGAQLKSPPKPTDPADNWRWRAVPGATGGEWVDSSAPPPAPLRLAPPAPVTPAPMTDLPEVSTGGWLVSSFDLLSGIDVVEGGDTVPADLFDQLFPPDEPPV